MTKVLLRALRQNPDIRVLAQLHAFHRPVAHWVRDEDGELRCVWLAS